MSDITNMSYANDNIKCQHVLVTERIQAIMTEVTNKHVPVTEIKVMNEVNPLLYMQLEIHKPLHHIWLDFP